MGDDETSESGNLVLYFTTRTTIFSKTARPLRCSDTVPSNQVVGGGGEARNQTISKPRKFRGVLCREYEFFVLP